MKKWNKIGLLTLLLIALLGSSYFLYIKEYINYVIITSTFSAICALVLINTLVSTRSEDSLYKSKLRQILRTYDSVLVKSKNLPKLDEKNIIKVDSIEDMVDAQMEIRKPIYYQEQTQSCAFVLLDNTEACIYILKVNDDVLCPLEIEIKELEIKKKAEESKDSNVNISEDTSEMLNGLENTTIIRVKKGKYIKVSPLKKNKDKKLVRETVEEVKDKVEETKEAVEETKAKVDAMDEKTEEIKDAVVENNYKSKKHNEPVDDYKENIEENEQPTYEDNKYSHEENSDYNASSDGEIKNDFENNSQFDENNEISNTSDDDSEIEVLHF